MKLGSGLTVCTAESLTSKKSLGRWRRGVGGREVPSCAAGGGIPGGQAAAEQDKGQGMFLLGWSLPKGLCFSRNSNANPPASLTPLSPSSCGSRSSSSVVGKRSSLGYSPPPAISLCICHLLFFPPNSSQHRVVAI